MIAVKMIFMNYNNKNSNCLKDFLKDFFFQKNKIIWEIIMGKSIKEETIFRFHR